MIDWYTPVHEFLMVVSGGREEFCAGHIYHEEFVLWHKVVP
jgi:hypothetical protein